MNVKAAAIIAIAIIAVGIGAGYAGVSGVDQLKDFFGSSLPK